MSAPVFQLLPFSSEVHWDTVPVKAMFVRPEQPWNISFPMLVTESGIINFFLTVMSAPSLASCLLTQASRNKSTSLALGPHRRTGGGITAFS